MGVGGGRLLQTGWPREASLRKGDQGRDLNDKESVLQGEVTAVRQGSQGRKVLSELEELLEILVAAQRGRCHQTMGRGGPAPEPV